MNDTVATTKLSHPVVGPSPAPKPVGLPRRMPLRATGLFAILGIMVLALLLVASALLFRGVVESHLAAVEQTQEQQAALLRRGLQESGTGSDSARLQQLEQQLRQSQADSAQHLAEARHHIDASTVAIACLAWLGITTIGAVAMLFFSRLAIDIGAVRARAQAIVVGDRSRSQPLARNDELSDLAQALDHLAEALWRHERDLEIERRHVMHQEKLAAIGSMAAGVLREIGNPIAAIDGYARAMMEAQRSDEAGAAPEAWRDPAQILHETARLAAITHEISELAAAPASQWQLASMNEIVTKSIALLRYEPRLEYVNVVPALDPQLPAVMAIADRLVLLLINLVTNAADATATLATRTARIGLETRCAAGGVELRVSDNGCGMNEGVLERAFEPLFTTKPPGRGTGLGLPLCRSIAHDHGGHITVESVDGQGTLVRVWLPLDTTGAATLAQ
ncbi:MAG: sensor histidine kinase [Burkholderiaceae bacterium]